ncbi:MAG TPA: SIS domain-containing protein [Acidimicrobiales bacterium]|nr:SIS domain-containing protein [Acidimicrobiales bacterium]
MCGIIAVLRRPGPPPEVDPAVVRVHLGRALDATDPSAAADSWAAVDASLRGVGGVRALLEHADLVAELERGTAEATETVAALEQALDADAAALSDRALEERNAALVRLKDAVWAVRHDRLRTAEAVADLMGGADAGLAAYCSVQTALSALDRLEVRGRDSAGLHILVHGHGLDLASAEVQSLLAGRIDDPLFTSLAVRTPAGHLAFVYKAAAEIGDLGDNSRVLREAIRGDELLRRALAADTAEVVVVGHTRWASVGIISQPNAHPLNHEEEGLDGPYVTAALNGDVDNYAELKEREGLRLPPEVTTDAKVIPTLVSRRLAEGLPTEEAFRRTVAAFEGSVAVAAHAADDPTRLLLALRGSGQALYVGLAHDAFVVASEPYGVVEETDRYVRMEGETGGEVLVLDATQAGTLEGIRRISYDGAESPVTEVQTAEITTRDIDRAGYQHYLLKEISEAPQSFRKTLRGRIVGDSVRVGDDTLPPSLRARLADGTIGRIVVIGQGTAAVAGQSVAAAVEDAVDGRLRVESLPATELSGFELDDDMSDTLVLAISQSGTTTDTNRTVDLVRARGAAVVSIVNRRNSDLVDKSDGVLYTSDGRDVEMSVASTKAFYAQIAAGFVLAEALAAELGVTNGRSADVLAGLRALPDAMEGVLARRDEIAQAAMRHAPSRRHWAIVGNGANRIAAQEIRIKLSELCYKAIACDVTEDKKHIDLSSEPLIFVCAAGLTGANADDVAKEVAIYRAHKAAPVVVATDGESRFTAAVHTISVPSAHPALAFVLSTMAGHLFGYEAALSIDAQARPLREARAAVESVVSSGATGDELLRRLASSVEQPASRFFASLRDGSYNGHLEASTAVRLASLLRYSTGAVPLDAYELEYGKVGTPGALLDDLVDALTRGIEELTRPIDAIKHQAKTVTVGISRSEEALFEPALVQAALAAGTPRDRLGYRTLRVLRTVDLAVAEVTGWTRYRVEGNPADEGATVHVVDQGGVARTLPSRTSSNPALRGTKHQVAVDRDVMVARGRSDGRTVVIVPEVKDNQATGLTLLHVRFHDRLPAEGARELLAGYRGRYTALVDAVTETEPAFDEERLSDIPVVDLLLEPIQPLADRWRRG